LGEENDMEQVIVANPELSAGQKIGIVISFLIGLAIIWLIIEVGKPKR